MQTGPAGPGSPWENGYNESFNSTLRDELLAREIFYTLEEARVLIERWRRSDNQVRSHSSLGYQPPAPVTIVPGRADPAFAVAGLRPDRPFPPPQLELTYEGYKLRGQVRLGSGYPHRPVQMAAPGNPLCGFGISEVIV